MDARAILERRRSEWPDMNGAATDGLIGVLLHERYLVESELGRGGMATVLLARDTRLGRPVVVKVPRLDGLSDPTIRRRFVAEINDLSGSEHPHILGILDQGEHEGIPFAVLQYLSGGDLGDRLRARGGRESATCILEWLRPIAQALDFIHSRGRLHRDVKTGNILFDEVGHPYLSDFGIATTLDVVDADSPTVAGRDQLTQVGTFVGSSAYAPPEAIDRVFTPAYDQYSLATAVYLALTGALPYEGRTHEAILVAKTTSDPAPLRHHDRDAAIPDACGPVLMKALSRLPENRFASCGDFADAFERASGSRRPAFRRHHVVRLLALGALLAAFALVWPRAAGWLGDSPWRAAREISVASPEGASAELGSREDELAAALELCAAHGDFCDPEEFSAETPHVYAVVPIRMDRFEVSNHRFAAFVKATGLETLAERRGYSWDGPTRHQGLSWRRPAADIEASQHSDWPVTHVTRAEARAFCEHAGGRLPTADEWEYQARGPERRTFPWGHAWSQERVRFSPTLALGLEPVGSHPGGTTPEGVHDLAGSVWEWTASDADAAALIKGGSWDTRNPAHFRSAAMGSLAEDETSSDLGFRCVWDR